MELHDQAATTVEIVAIIVRIVLSCTLRCVGSTDARERTMCMQLNHLPGLEGEVVTNKIFDQRGLRLRVALGAKEPTVTAFWKARGTPPAHLASLKSRRRDRAG